MSRILRLPEVKKMVGVGTSTIYKMMNEGTFPQNVKLGERAVGWSADHIEGWIKSKTNNTETNEVNHV